MYVIIRGHVGIVSVIHPDCWGGYHGLGVICIFMCIMGKNEFVRSNFHIYDIESFWSYAKIRLVKFLGWDKKSFNPDFRECTFVLATKYNSKFFKRRIRRKI